MRTLFVSLLLITNLWASDCIEGLENAIIIDYEAKILDASKTLGITPDDFKNRLKTFGYTNKTFFDEVEFYRQGNKVKYWDYILSPRKILREVRGRQVTNTTVLSSFFLMASIHLGAHSLAHLATWGPNNLDLLSAQVAALLITEIALTTSSAKHAAYLVANPNLLKDARKMADELPIDDKLLFAGVRKKLRSLRLGLRDILQNTKENIKPLAKVAFASSLLPYGLLASGAVDTASELIVATLINSGFHMAYVSMWSNFRYELFYGKLFPAISNSRIANSKIAEKTLITGLITANMVVASYTYTYGSTKVWELTGQKNKNNENHEE